MSSGTPISVVVNGQPVETEDQILVPEFLRGQEMNPDRVVVELNGRAQTRTESSATRLSDGDKLEVVRIVAGG